MYATDRRQSSYIRQTADAHHRLIPPTLAAGAYTCLQCHTVVTSKALGVCLSAAFPKFGIAVAKSLYADPG